MVELICHAVTFQEKYRSITPDMMFKGQQELFMQQSMLNRKLTGYPVIISTRLAGLVLSFSLLLTTGCKKDEVVPAAPRTIRFELYTDQDFSLDTKSIVFKPNITDGNKVLWDSVFSAVQIKDIPSPAHKIVFEKVILNNSSDLKVGFEYTIENVGISWYYVKATPAEATKTVSFNFR